MSGQSDFSFKMQGTIDGRIKNLIYTYGSNKLEISLDMAGGWKYDWAAVDTSFNYWTEPKGQPISEEKKAEILFRLAEWSEKEKIRIHVGPPIDKEEMFRNYEKKGWKIEKLPDGSIRVSPPKRYSIVKRVIDLLKGNK